MSGTAPERGGSERDIAAALRLRPDTPRVMRLSRRVLIGLGVAAGLGVGAALIVALQGRSGGEGPRELSSTDRNPQADGLAGLPRDYAGTPQLGPPLPGDLGRPIVRAQERGQPVVPPAAPTTTDPAEQRRTQEIEAARTSRLFVQVEARGEPRGAAPAGPLSADPGEMPIGSDGTDRRLAFLGGPADRRTTSPDRLQTPASPFVIRAGSVIPAALLTGLRSDLPGQITAQVTANVFDSPTGRHLLIPQGARLIGAYDSRVSFGQRRILLVWNRLILPNDRSIVLERMPGADEAGYAGLEDGVDYHLGAAVPGRRLGDAAESQPGTRPRRRKRYRPCHPRERPGYRRPRRRGDRPPAALRAADADRAPRLSGARHRPP
jgi:type IV secretion system protein VirB10